MRHMIMHRIPAFVFATMLTAALPAHGATLRTLTTLSAPTVRLSDLFDDAGPNAALVLGPGPVPGARIVVEAPQLAAIARQFGVDWHPASSADHAVLDRPGRPLAREDVIAALRAALTGAGAPADADIQLPGFTAPLVAPEAHPQTVVEQLAYDADSGRFTGMLEVVGKGMPSVAMRLAGSLTAMIEVPVPFHNLPAGSVIDPDDLHIARVRADLAKGEVLASAAQAVGLAAKHELNAGQPVPLSALVRPMAVHGGAPVAMELQEAGINLIAEGQALGSGSIGERIRVLNPSSHAVVEADVIGPGRVRVTPGSLPLEQPGGRAVQVSSAGEGVIIQ
jgi:flagella basal body P-ring formation protein FlgA